MQNEKKKILVVEDEFITAADLIANLEYLGYNVPASTDTGQEVLELAEKYMPDLIMMDINLKGEMTGIDVAEEIRDHLDIPIIFLTGQSDEATISKAIESEPFGYIIKPFEERSLKTAIMMALYKHSIDKKLKASEIKYRKISENSDNLIMILNSDSSIDYINLAGSDFFQKKPLELTGIFLNELLTPDDNATFNEKIQLVMSKSSGIRDQTKLTLFGKELWFDSTLIPLSEDISNSEQILWIARDITDFVEIHREIEKKGIIQIEKNMEQFQILNDQIRNPLTVIASLASLDDGPSTEKILKYVKKIDDLVDQLDKGWIESNKIRSYFLRHYKHGEEFWG